MHCHQSINSASNRIIHKRTPSTNIPLRKSLKIHQIDISIRMKSRGKSAMDYRSHRYPNQRQNNHKPKDNLLQCSKKLTKSGNLSNSRVKKNYKINVIKMNDKVHLQCNFLNRDCYKQINMIGKGGFGKVWKVQHYKTCKFYAMKQISKAIVITKRSIQSMTNQRHFLQALSHQFLVRMLYAFQDENNVYIIMDLLEGGDLRYHLTKMIKFTEKETKFMIASIILALEYMHKKTAIHRDVKPENIVFSQLGYAYLADMGITKYFRQNNSIDSSGTPGYMAPEVMFHHNHGYEVDFYALGIVIYEIIMGQRPYLGRNREEVKTKVKHKQAMIRKNSIPQGWSIQSADFTNKLLQRKPVKRLGWGGMHELKKHEWFQNFPWQCLQRQQLSSPIERFYNYKQVRYRPDDNNTEYNEILCRNREILKKGHMQQYFQGFTYSNNQNVNLIL